MQDNIYSVGLELKTDGFKQKMKETQSFAKTAGQKLQESLKMDRGLFDDPELTRRVIETDNNISKLSVNFGKLSSNMSLVKKPIFDVSTGLKEVSKESDKTEKNIKKISTGSKNIGDTISKAFTKGLKSVKKLTLGFLGARSAFSLFRKYMSEYQSQNEGFAQKMQSITLIITNALAPAFEFFGNILQKVAVILGRILGLIFKVDILGKTLNSNLKGTANSTKEIGDNLSGLDEISNIQESNGGGDVGSGLSLPDVDTSKFEEAFEKIKLMASELFKPIQKAWDKVGKNLINSAKKMGKSLLDLFGSVGKSLTEVWTNGTGEKLVTNSLKLWQRFFDIISGVADAIKQAWENESSGTTIVQSIADIISKIQEFALSVADSIKKWVLSKNFQLALNTVFKIFSDVFKIVKDIVGWTSDMYQKYLAPVVDKILNAIGSIIQLIGAVWKIIQPTVNETVGIIKSVLEPVLQIVTGSIGKIIDVLRGVAEFLTGVFTGNWKKAWNGIKIAFDGVWNGMRQVANGVVNLIISAINILIRGINNVVTPIRGLIVAIGKVLGKNYTMDNIRIPSIPKLDVGTNYVPEDMLAMIHKGEAVVPKEFNQKEYFGNEETNALLIELNKNVLELANRPQTLNINGKEFAKATYGDFQEETSRRGANTSVRRV